MFEIKLCKSKGAYSAKPTKTTSLDLNKIRKEFKVVDFTPAVMVIDFDGEIIIHQHGELLFKGKAEKDIEEMKRIANKVYEVGKR